MQPTNNVTESTDSEEVSFRDILHNFLAYWPGILLLILISLTGAWFYLRYSLPVYQTTASLLIKDDKKAGALDPLEAFDLFGGKKSVENEVEILKSKTLMQEVVKNLHLYASVQAKGRLVSSSAYSISPIIIEVKHLDSIIRAKNVRFEYDPLSQTLAFENHSYPLNKYVNTPYGVIKFLPNEIFGSHSKTQNKEQVNFSFSINSVKSTSNDLLKILNVTPSSKQSTVIDLSIKIEVPKLGEDVLNELLKVYNKAAILDKNILAANTLKFVENRLDFVVKDLDSVENSLQKFKAANKIVDISTQGKIYLQTVSENDQKVSEINMQLAMLDEVQSYVRGQGDLSGVVPVTLGIADPVLTNLLKNLSDLELKYEQTRKIVPENNPAVISLVDAIGKLKPGILQNILSQRNNLIAAKTNINTTNERFSSLLKNIPENEKQILDISRQQSIKNNIYTFLLQKREETALSFASAVADSRIIDNAETSEMPVSPDKKIIYLAAFIGALVIGLAFIYLKDLLTMKVQGIVEVERQTSVPILGEVAFDYNKTPIVISEGKRSFIAEQFRQLRTSLGYLGIDDTHKRIMVTSSISGEGKSFIAINLAISLSLMDKKVAVLELDLRKPKLSEVFNLSRAVGISNYLVGKKNLPDIMKETGIKNLVLLPSGPIPPNPSELLSNGRLEKLLTELEEHFDYIIIDTGPTNPVTDAFLVSPISDVSVYIVRHDYTPKMFLPKLETYKESGRLKNMAVVYNGVKGKGIGKYGYGYGYGYTEEGDERQGWWKRIFKN